MGVGVLVLGYSGSGKSTSLRNFKQDEIGVLNVARKPLPFRHKLATIQGPDYQAIQTLIKSPDYRAYVIDDANYLMAFESFRAVNVKGYEKFTQMAANFEQLLETVNATDPDTIVYVMMHPEMDEAGRLKPKTIGKMLDNQLTIEGMFPIVLRAYKDDEGYHFATQSQGDDPAKSPMGMFADEVIDNDLKAVDQAIREYWELKPLVDGKAGK